MPRCYFDIWDGVSATDTEGAEFPTYEAACDEALATLGQIAKDVLASKPFEKLVIDVRDGDKVVFTASLSLRIEQKA